MTVMTFSSSLQLFMFFCAIATVSSENVDGDTVHWPRSVVQCTLIEADLEISNNTCRSTVVQCTLIEADLDISNNTCRSTVVQCTLIEAWPMILNGTVPMHHMVMIGIADIDGALIEAGISNATLDHNMDDPSTRLIIIEGGSDIVRDTISPAVVVSYDIYIMITMEASDSSRHTISWLDVLNCVLGTIFDPDFKTNPHLLGNMNVRHRSELKEQRAWMVELVRMIEGRNYSRLDEIVRDWIYSAINKTAQMEGYHYYNTQARAEFMKSNLKTNYDELLRLLKRNLDSINVAIEADVVTESYQISPRELVEVITKAIQLEQQQIEKIERLQQVMEEEGAPTILRGSKREAEDEKYRKIHLLLTLFLAWFLLCYCSDSTVWCVDIDLTFGLSLALSEIVLLLGGDIEKNPGPLSSMYIL